MFGYTMKYHNTMVYGQDIQRGSMKGLFEENGGIWLTKWEGPEGHRSGSNTSPHLYCSVDEALEIMDIIPDVKAFTYNKNGHYGGSAFFKNTTGGTWYDSTSPKKGDEERHTWHDHYVKDV